MNADTMNKNTDQQSTKEVLINGIEIYFRPIKKLTDINNDEHPTVTLVTIFLKPGGEANPHVQLVNGP